MNRYHGCIRLWAPTVAMMLVSLISYIDRNTLALLSPAILAETGLSAEQYGYIISAFSVAYMIGESQSGGRCSTALACAAGCPSAVSFWTFASVAHAFAGGFWRLRCGSGVAGFR